MIEYRGFNIGSDGVYGMQLIKPVGGRGSVPTELRGAYTTQSFAIKAIDLHFILKEAKHGKAVSTT